MSLHRLSTIFLFLTASICLIQAFTAPLPFGGVDVNEKPDGHNEVSIHNGFNVSGNGVGSGLTVGGGNGSGGIQSHSGILANGSQFGTSHSVTGDKDKSATLGSNLNVGKETVRSGTGKRGNLGAAGGKPSLFPTNRNEMNKNDTAAFQANLANGGNMIATILPSLMSGGGNFAGGGGPGFLGSFTQAIPALRNFPGLNDVSVGRDGATGLPGLDSAINRFAGPVVNMAAGNKPGPADIRQMIDTVPDLIVNMPNFGDVDLTKVPPNVLNHVLRGGQILGIPRETLDRVVQRYAQRMYDAAMRARRGESQPGDEKYLPKLRELSPEVVQTFTSPKSIPYLSQEQIRVIQEYYTSQIPVEISTHAKDGNNSINPQMFSMLNLLPPNYNLSKIPPVVIQQVLHGEMPDWALLPQDIIEYLRTNSDKIFSTVKFPANSSIEDLLIKLPRFEPPVFNVTFAPYDINKVDSDLVLKEEGFLSSSQMKWLTGGALVLLAVVSTVVLGVYIYFQRKNRSGSPTTNESL